MTTEQPQLLARIALGLRRSAAPKQKFECRDRRVEGSPSARLVGGITVCATGGSTQKSDRPRNPTPAPNCRPVREKLESSADVSTRNSSGPPVAGNEEGFPETKNGCWKRKTVAGKRKTVSETGRPFAVFRSDSLAILAQAIGSLVRRTPH